MSIIGDGIMLGAGGATASIFVTGLSETDTVTASKDGKTVIGKWTQIPNPASGVPDEYTRLEYIESTGTQYINTEYKPNPNTVMSMDLLMGGSFKPSTTYGGDSSIFGTTDSTNACYSANFGGDPNQGNQLIIWPQTTYESGGKAESLYINDTIRTTRNTLTIYNGSATWGSVSTTIPVKTTSLSTSLLLFGVRYLDGTIKQFTSYNMRLFEWRVEENGVVVRNAVPAKRNSDGAIGLYDKVENKFYANIGTGAFTAGAEIPQTIDGFLIDKIKDYGTWTVTATNGTKTATQDILVDVITNYEIEMSLSA